MKIPTNSEIMDKVILFLRFLTRYGIVVAIAVALACWGYRNVTEAIKPSGAMYLMPNLEEGDTVNYDGVDYKVRFIYKYYGETRIDFSLEGDTNE